MGYSGMAALISVDIEDEVLVGFGSSNGLAFWRFTFVDKGVDQKLLPICCLHVLIEGRNICGECRLLHRIKK